MKIIFIGTSLEPGKDGVGDYIRQIASELIRQGHIITAISLNDKSVSDRCIEYQKSGEINLQVLRLPSNWKIKDRINDANKFIDEFNPDWLSLQFVIFGYHKKGLPFWLGNYLSLLGKGRKWHIMFHELWLGMEVGATLKHLICGVMQRLIIKSLITTLKPQKIHTQTQLYQQQLAKIGCKAQQLSLFGNIPKIEFDHGSIQDFSLLKSLNFVLFGHIHPGTPIAQFAMEASAYSIKNRIKIILTIVGICGAEQEHWVKNWSSAGMVINVLGEQTVDNISKILSLASIGISTTPVALIKKSGSVAAMHEHGLPVICVQNSWKPKKFRNLNIPAGVVKYEIGNFESILSGGLRPPVANTLLDISKKLINSL